MSAHMEACPLPPLPLQPLRESDISTVHMLSRSVYERVYHEQMNTPGLPDTGIGLRFVWGACL
jgi:hypothetical protein